MGFLGGLAGTLGKILETQGEEQRKESALMRAEERADLRKFNAENNEEIINGVPSYVLRGKNGILSSRPIPQHVLDERESKVKGFKADNVENDAIIQDRAAYDNGIADGTLKPEVTYNDWTASKKSTAEVNAAVEKEKALLPFKIGDEKRALSNSITLQENAANNKKALTPGDKAMNAFMTDVIKGDRDITASGVTAARARQIALDASNGDPIAINQLANIIRHPSTTITKKGTPSAKSLADRKPGAIANASGKKATDATPPPKGQ